MKLSTSQLLEAKRQLDFISEVAKGVFAASDSLRAKGYVTVPLVDQNIEAVVASDDKSVTIVFMGTDDMMDFIRDIEFVYEDTMFGKIHRGFWKGWTSIHDEVMRALEAVNPGGSLPVYVTGHSLGAALATLCLQTLDDLGYTLGESFVFGCPRMGDKVWRVYFDHQNIPLIRIAGNNDIVTMIPFLFGYSHAGQVAYISKDGVLTDKRKLSLRLLTISWWAWILNSLEEHRLVGYAKSVEKALAKVGWYG